MAIYLERTLRKALAELQAEQDTISHQIIAIQKVLAADIPQRKARKSPVGGRSKRARKSMSAAGRKAVSRRMKAYWAKRKAEVTKAKGQGSK